MAARVLSRAGCRVRIYEARDRAGGRMHTRDGDGAGAPIEYGPEFVHGLPRVTLELLRESGDATVDTSGVHFDRAHGRLAASDDDAFEQAERVLERGARVDPDCSIDALLERAVRDGVAPEVAQRTRALVAGFDAADPALASARAIAEEWTGDASAEGVQSRPIHGYASLIRYVVRSLDPNMTKIYFQSVVTRIALCDGGVELDVRSETGLETIRADAAIVTVPLGVLRASSGEEGAIAFEPSLPQSHRRALTLLAMGSVRKVVLQFDDAFWERLDGGRYRDGGFFGTERGPFPTMWTQLPVRARTLTAWAGGPAATAIASLDSQAVIAAALQSAIDLFDAPEARERFVRGYDHDWQHDPYARGAYSYALVGAGDARASLGEIIDDRLVIAGEATARGAEGGTVAGAFESGERAAHALLRR